jgi:hypothetical protein
MNINMTTVAATSATSPTCNEPDSNIKVTGSSMDRPLSKFSDYALPAKFMSRRQRRAFLMGCYQKLLALREEGLHGLIKEGELLLALLKDMNARDWNTLRRMAGLRPKAAEMRMRVASNPAITLTENWTRLPADVRVIDVLSHLDAVTLAGLLHCEKVHPKMGLTKAKELVFGKKAAPTPPSGDQLLSVFERQVVQRLARSAPCWSKGERQRWIASLGNMIAMLHRPRAARAR